MIEIANMTAGHPYPLLQGGGGILLCVGATTMLSAVFPRAFVPLFFIGFGLGLTSVYALGLAVRVSDLPDVAQLYWFGAAVLFEVALVVAIVFRVQEAERAIGLVLLVVALHFGIMGASHGPVFLALGLLTLLNALAMLLSGGVRPYLAVDGLLKIAFGALALWHAPRWTYEQLLQAGGF